MSTISFLLSPSGVLLLSVVYFTVGRAASVLALRRSVATNGESVIIDVGLEGGQPADQEPIAA